MKMVFPGELPLHVVQVGDVTLRDGKFAFNIFPSFSEETLWPGSLPVIINAVELDVMCSSWSST